MGKEKIINDLMAAADNGEEITIVWTIDEFNGLVVHFVPDAVELNGDILLIYEGENTFIMDISKEIRYPQVGVYFFETKHGEIKIII